MTRDEYRKACIEAMAEAAAMYYWRWLSKEFRPHKDADWEHCSDPAKNVWRSIITAAIDAMPGELTNPPWGTL